MVSPKTLSRIEGAVWICIYGGLLTLVLGVFTIGWDDDLAGSLIGWGGSVAAFGVLLIYVRSRLRAAPPTSKP